MPSSSTSSRHSARIAAALSVALSVASTACGEEPPIDADAGGHDAALLDGGLDADEGAADAASVTDAGSAGDAAEAPDATPAVTWLQLDGPVIDYGTPPPATGQVAIYWLFEDAHRWGTGVSNGDTFEVSLAEPPPIEALHVNPSTGTMGGMGFVYLFGDDVVLPPDGPIDPDQPWVDPIGFAGMHAVFYVSAPVWTQWGVFPAGYSCAECLDVAGDVDEWVPGSCEGFQITTGDSETLPNCNWWSWGG